MIPMIKPIEEVNKNNFLKAWFSHQSENVVITHNNCEDGRGTAVVCHTTRLKNGVINDKESTFTDMEFIFTDYGEYDIDAIVAQVKGKVVYVGDFSFLDEDYLAIKDSALEVVMVDHHYKPMLNSVSDLPNTHFDNTKSGALLTWEFFYGENIEPPLAIKLISDRDLYKFKYGDKSRAFHLFLKSKDKNDFRVLLPMVISCDADALTNKSVDMFIDEVIISENKYRDKGALAVPYNINGYDFVGLNLTSSVSDVLNKAGQQFGLPAMAWWVIDEYIYFSLRNSNEEGVDNGTSVNVSDLAGVFGGGGHPQAAGFKILLKDLDLEEFFTHNTLNKK